jgi:hypothetical protein
VVGDARETMSTGYELTWRKNSEGVLRRVGAASEKSQNAAGCRVSENLGFLLSFGAHALLHVLDKLVDLNTSFCDQLIKTSTFQENRTICFPDYIMHISST